MRRQVIGGERERMFGRISNLSSVNWRRGQADQCNHAAVKPGAMGPTRALALRTARKNVTVSAAASSYRDTGMHACHAAF